MQDREENWQAFPLPVARGRRPAFPEGHGAIHRGGKYYNSVRLAIMPTLLLLFGVCDPAVKCLQ